MPGFDPNEPRDYHGRWTIEGAGEAIQQAASDNKTIAHNVQFQKRAVFNFTKAEGAAVNKYLNDPEKYKDEIHAEANNLSIRFDTKVSPDDVINAIDNYLRRSDKISATTYRGLNFSGKPDEGADVWTGAYSGKEAQAKYEDFKNAMKVGNVFTDKGYMSSSKNEQYAERFTHPGIGSAKPIQTYSAFLTIKDDRGVDVTKDSFRSDPQDRPAGYNYIMHERNAKFKVVDAREETITGKSPYRSSFQDIELLFKEAKRLNVTIERINL